MKLLNTVMENVLNDFCGATSWHHAISHHTMEVIKVEPDLDTESLNRSPVYEDPLFDETEDQDQDPLVIKSAEVKQEVKNTLFHLHRQIGMKNAYPPMKMEQSVPKCRHIKFRRPGITQKKAYNKQEEPCDVTTVKEELADEITVDECYVCSDSVEHLTSHQWHPGITGDTSSICANVRVGTHREGDAHSENETTFQECGTRRKYSDLGSEVEANDESKKSKHDSKKKEGILYKCKICSKSISRKENLVIHNRIHTGEKPFRCEICNKSFVRRDGLVRHTRIHTGDKPFSCEVCNKGFIQRGDLVVHTRTHTGEKPFKCRICNKRFKQSAVLASHSRIHTGDKCFKCDVCNKEFTQHGGLVRHTRSHSGDKPFRCQVCSKRFAMRGDLVRHTRIHTRDKGDDSEGCDTGFTRCADPDFDIYSRTGDHVFSS